DIVTSAADQGALVVHHVPRRSTVVGTPDGPLIDGLDQRVDTLAVRWRDRDVDLAERPFRKAGGLDVRPRITAVVGDVDAARHPAAEHPPRVHHDLPRP